MKVKKKIKKLFGGIFLVVFSGYDWHWHVFALAIGINQRIGAWVMEREQSGVHISWLHAGVELGLRILEIFKIADHVIHVDGLNNLILWLNRLMRWLTRLTRLFYVDHYGRI